MRYYAGVPFIGAFGKTEGLLNTLISDKTIQQYDYIIINDSDSSPDRAAYLAKMLL